MQPHVLPLPQGDPMVLGTILMGIEPYSLVETFCCSPLDRTHLDKQVHDIVRDATSNFKVENKLGYRSFRYVFKVFEFKS